MLVQWFPIFAGEPLGGIPSRLCASIGLLPLLRSLLQFRQHRNGRGCELIRRQVSSRPVHRPGEGDRHGAVALELARFERDPRHQAGRGPVAAVEDLALEGPGRESLAMLADVFGQASNSAPSSKGNIEAMG